MHHDEERPTDPPGFSPDTIPSHRIVETQSASIDELRQLYFQSMGDGIAIVDANGVHVDANPAFCEMTGYSLQELLGSRPEHRYWPPGERERIERASLGSLRGETSEIELTLMHKDGRRFPVIVKLFAIRCQSDVISHYAATVRNLSQQASMQAALLDSQTRYRRLFECAADAIVILQGDTIIDCNERALEMFGATSLAQLASRASYEYSPRYQPNGQESRAFSLDRLQAAQRGKPQFFAWRHLKFDGSTFDADVSLSTFTLGESTLIQANIRDITERTRMENALRDSEQRYRALFDSAGEAIMILKDQQVVDCNEQALKMTGRTRDEILSNPTVDYFPAQQPDGTDSRQLLAERIDASLSGTPQVFEWTGQIADGTTRHSEVTLTSFLLGETRYTQSIIRDITQRKQLEAALLELNSDLESRVHLRTQELEQTNAELSRRTADLRALAAKLIQSEHEERQRIARFLHDNQQQLLVAAKLRAEILQSASHSLAANLQGRALLAILEQAIDMSRTLTMELAPPVLYGAGLVAAMQWLAQWMCEHHHLHVAVTGELPATPLPTDVSITVFQVVRELLLNVSKHAGVRQARVSLSLAGRALRVAVSDDGVGFDVAATLQSPRSLGLFGIQERLDLLDGQLAITSQIGLGTTCTLAIPVAEPALPQPEALHAQNASTQPRVGPALPQLIRVLVVDDHAGAREGVAQVLGLVADFAVVGQACDGLDAIEQAQLLLPDVVLMDMSMPQLDGLEATRHLRLHLPAIKVIGFSMHAREQVQAQWLAAGACCYLQKNQPVEELVAAIRVAMRAAEPVFTNPAVN